MAEYATEDGRCRAQIPGVCTRYAQAFHERRKASAGGNREPGQDNTVPLCHACNGYLEDHPAASEHLHCIDGLPLVVREGDPDWERFGRRS